MSGTSNKMNPIELIAAAAEKRAPGCIAICASNWHLPVYKQTLAYTVATSRKQTPLEEYILKAANLNLSYNIDTSMLPSLLGLDDIFIDTTIDILADKGLLNTDMLPILKLTEAGENYLLQKTIPDEEHCEEINYFIDRKSALVYASPKEDDRFGMHPRYEQIDKMKDNVKKYINRKFLFQTAQLLGKTLENPDDGIRVTSIVSARITGSSKSLYTEICLYDIINDKFVLKIWDHALRCFRNDISDYMEQEKISGEYRVTALYGNENYKRIRNLVGDTSNGFRPEIFRGDDAAKLLEEEKNQGVVNIIDCTDDEFKSHINSQKSVIVQDFTPVSCEGNFILCEKPVIKFSR